MNRAPHPLRSAVAAAVLCATGLAASQAMAALPGKAERQQIEQTYRAERAACLDGSSTQERSACLAEARAVRQEALRGELGVLHDGSNAMAEPTPDMLMANALLRCEAVPADVRNDCARRVHGEGTVVGSVAEGGILRELPAQPAPAMLALSPQPAPQPASEAATAPLPPAVAQPEATAASTAATTGSELPADTALAPGEQLEPAAPLAATAQPANPSDAAADMTAASPADTSAAARADSSATLPADTSTAATVDDLAARPADAMTDMADMATPAPAADPSAQPQR